MRLPVTNIVEFMKFAIRRIPKATLSVLSVASCMGNTFSLELLKGVVVGELSERIRERLDELVFMRFLTRTGEDTFAFTNSAYQQAAYEFLSEDDRQAIHMKIGFAILKVRHPLISHRACSLLTRTDCSCRGGRQDSGALLPVWEGHEGAEG